MKNPKSKTRLKRAHILLSTVAVAGGHQKEFGRHFLNYYVWFELTEANCDTEVIAEYRFGLDDSGGNSVRSRTKWLSPPSPG